MEIKVMHIDDCSRCKYKRDTDNHFAINSDL